MSIPSIADAPASTDSSASQSQASPTQPDSPPLTCQQEPVRHMLFGSLSAVQSTIRLLYKLNYAEPNDWSQPISTGRPNEVMAILTKWVRVEVF